MQLSKFEQLALFMLADIYEKVGADGVDPKLIRQAITSGNTWGLEWEYTGIFSEETPEEVVNEVCNILDMWSFIEEAGGEQFPGFDGNREASFANVASFFTEQLDRFARFKGRTGHGVLSLDGYRRMYEKFEPIRANLGGRNPVRLTPGEVEELIAERVHPSNRT